MNNLVTVDLESEHTKSIKAVYYQHDFGVKVRLINTHDLSLLIEFCNYGDKKIQHETMFTGADVSIPEDILKDGRDVWLFVSVKTPDYVRTLKEVIVRVIRRPWR